MNTKNNARRRASRDKIESVFVSLLQKKELARISVREICAAAGLNRSTFYANYEDVYALADSVRDTLAQDIARMYQAGLDNRFQSDNWQKLFEHIKDNQIFYNTYFKLGYDSDTIDLSKLHPSYFIFPAEYMEYHIEFFRAGFNAIVKKWLACGCKESPAEMNAILIREYGGRQK